MEICNYNNLFERSNFIAGSPAFVNVPFFLKSVNIPSITLQMADLGSREGFRPKLTGDTISFGSLSLEVLIDENMNMYEEIYNLLIKQVNPAKGTLSLFDFPFWIDSTNNKGLTSLKFMFNGCRISTIGDIILDTFDESNEIILPVEIEFDNFYIERVKNYNILPGDPQKITSVQNKFFDLYPGEFETYGEPIQEEQIQLIDGSVIPGLVLNSPNLQGITLNKILKNFQSFRVEFFVLSESFKDIEFGIKYEDEVISSFDIIEDPAYRKIQSKIGQNVKETGLNNIENRYSVEYINLGSSIKITTKINDIITNENEIDHPEGDLKIYFEGSKTPDSIDGSTNALLSAKLKLL